MSSFICSRRHFDSIAKGVIHLLQSGDFYLSRKLENHLRKLNRTAHNSEKRTDELIAILVEELAALQVRCVCLQYKSTDNVEDEIAEQVEILKVKLTKPIDLKPVSLYRAICCALYQIETNHLIKIRPLSPAEEGALTFFETLNTELAEQIVQKLPEFRNGQWGIA